LDGTGNVVVFLSNETGVKHTRGGIEGIDGRVDTELSNLTGKHSGGVKMGKGGGRSGISKIISGHVNGLDRGNGTTSGGGNTLLQRTQIGGKSGLVTDGRRNTTEKSRHLRTGLSETEDVVNEEQDILTLSITEVFGNGETSKSDTSTGSRRLVHLTIHKSGLGTRILELNDTSLNHFVVQIVSFTSSLSDSGKH